MNNKNNLLNLEPLERRELLSATITGIEPDGDLFEIKLSGPGEISNPSLDNLILSGTSSSSQLTIKMTRQVGDGSLSVGSIDTNLNDLKQIKIDGDLGGLQAGEIGKLDVESLGKIAGNTNSFTMNGEINQVIAPYGIFDADITINGSLDQLSVGHKKDSASDIKNSVIVITGKLNKMNLKQSLTADSSIDANGGIQSVDIDKYIVNSDLISGGTVKKFDVGGGIIRNSDINITGDVMKLKVNRAVSELMLNIDGTLQKATFQDDINESTITTNTIKQMAVKDRVVQSNISATGDIEKLQLDDARLMVIRVGGSLESVSIKQGMDTSLISVLNDIDTIKIGADVYRSGFLAGLDVGEDFLPYTADDSFWGDLSINQITINGDMTDSGISAGVHPTIFYYGDGDDAPTNNNIGTAIIKKVTVKGEISSSSLPGETYAITAADGIEMILSQGNIFSGTDGVVVQSF